MHLLMSLRYVAAGGALGALVRWGSVGAAGDAWSAAAVLALNVLGSLLLGLLVGMNLTRTGHTRVTENQFLLVGTGFCGGLTTFSTYSVQVAEALDDGALAEAALVGFSTGLIAVLFAGIGYRIGSRP